MMQERTWPYGTTRRGEVVTVTLHRVGTPPRPTAVLVVEDDQGEGHILIGTDSDECSVGDTGTLTFTRGGPKGGYWRFAKDPTASPPAGRRE